MNPSVLKHAPSDRERVAEEIAERMDGPVSALGFVFLLLVLADTVVEARGAVATAFNVASWVLWGIFVAEFVLRAVVAPSTARFLRRNWWQLLFLAVPFLRFARILSRLRLARIGRVVSSALRSTRTAQKTLSSRLGWLTVSTLIVVLASSQLLYEFGQFESYGEALHAAALATITGEPIGDPSGVTQVLEVALALYSVVVFATLAGTLGAYFLSSSPPPKDAEMQTTTRTPR